MIQSTQRAAAHWIRRLAADEPLRFRLAIAILILACWAPRATLAWRRDVLGTDGVFYIEKAEALRTGDVAAGLSELQLNLYPLLLAALRNITGEYETTGKWLSVWCATAAVVPLVATVRRWGGNRLALIAGALYACHPESIEWSPEIIRDPLFWLLMWSTLWTGWMAATSLRPGWFVVVGLLLACSILTRFEGWFLALPLVWWTLSAVQSRQAWRPVATGWALAAAMCPLVLLAVNLGPLAGHDRWEWGRFEHFSTAAHWLVRQVAPPSAAGHLPSQSGGATTGEADVAEISQRFSVRAMRWGFRHTLTRGWHPAWMYLGLCGIAVALHREHTRPDRASSTVETRLNWLPVLFVSALLLASVWVYLWKYQEINKRYFLLPMYCWLPYAAQGLAANIQWLSAAGEIVARRRNRSWPHVAPAATSLWLGALAIVGTADALAGRYDGRTLKADVGREIAAEYGPGLNILCSEDAERVIGYYAQASHRKLPDNVVGDEAVRWLLHWRPDLLVLWLPGEDSASLSPYYPLIERALADGWQRRYPTADPPSPAHWPDRLIVLVRPDVALAAAERKAAGSKSLATKPVRGALK